MADALSIISVISFIIAGVCFVLAVFCWFYFRIPGVIGYFTGRTARKSIARTRKSNEASGNKSYRPSLVNVKRGKLTGTMPDTALRSDNAVVSSVLNQAETGILDENRAPGVTTGQTWTQEGHTTEILNTAAEDGNIPTAVPEVRRETAKKKLRMIDEVIYTHTDETIE